MKELKITAATKSDIKKNAHGGPGRGQGLKAADGATNLKRTNISIDPDSANALRAFGDGDLSLGIRRAAAQVKNIYGDGHEKSRDN